MGQYMYVPEGSGVDSERLILEPGFNQCASERAAGENALHAAPCQLLRRLPSTPTDPPFHGCFAAPPPGPQPTHPHPQ
eukprot:358383-Chlamydomonas_euryale.AAC.2